MYKVKHLPIGTGSAACWGRSSVARISLRLILISDLVLQGWNSADDGL